MCLKEGILLALSDKMTPTPLKDCSRQFNDVRLNNTHKFTSNVNHSNHCRYLFLFVVITGNCGYSARFTLPRRKCVQFPSSWWWFQPPNPQWQSHRWRRSLRSSRFCPIHASGASRCKFESEQGKRFPVPTGREHRTAKWTAPSWEWQRPIGLKYEKSLVKIFVSQFNGYSHVIRTRTVRTMYS